MKFSLHFALALTWKLVLLSYPVPSIVLFLPIFRTNFEREKEKIVQKTHVSCHTPPFDEIL